MRSVVAVGATLVFLVVYKIQIVLVGPVKLHHFSFTLTEHTFDFQSLATQTLLSGHYFYSYLLIDNKASIRPLTDGSLRALSNNNNQ